MLAMRSREPSLHSAIDDFLARGLQGLHMGDHGLEHVDGGIRALRRKIPALPRAGIDDAGSRSGTANGVNRASGQRPDARPFVLASDRAARAAAACRHTPAWVLHGLAPRLVIIVDLPESLARGVFALRFDRDRRAGEIIEQRIHSLLEQRQPMLHAGMAAAFADRLIKQIVALGRAECRDIAHAEAADGFGDQLEFGDRHQIERTHVEQRALGFGIEDRIDSRESPKKSNRTG